MTKAHPTEPMRRVAGPHDVAALLERFEIDLIGSAPVKEKVRNLASLLLIDMARRAHGLEAKRPVLHMCFLGRPGTGKTVVARRVAEMLFDLGYLDHPRVHAVTRDDLVGSGPGDSGRRTHAAVAAARGGVLFLDEAYTVCRGTDDVAGLEAVEALMQDMENHRAELAVVLAGYPDRMGAFFGLNEGLWSRVAHVVDFPDLETDDLLEVAARLAHESGYTLDASARAVLAERLDDARQEPDFANARTVRNLFDAARLRHATRLLGGGHRDLSIEELTVLTGDDLLFGTPGPCARSSRLYAAAANQ